MLLYTYQFQEKNMKIIDQTLKDFQIEYPLETIAPLEEFLFVDIETTGFTARSSSLYLIGTAFCRGGSWCIRQWFGECTEDQPEILKDFFTFAAGFTHLVHFNGNNFDLPYLLQKCKQYALPYHFDPFEGLDLYKRISPYKFFLHTSNCKQKTLEELMGIDREDLYNGGELISIYQEYVQSPSGEALDVLLLHNSDDVKGMLQILPLLSFYDLFNGSLRAVKVQSNQFVDYHGHERRELLMKLFLPSALPFPVSNLANGCYFSGEKQDGILKVPVYEEEMKYFYSNYKDYYYLPDEDIAIHKSVASFVDKEHRTQALASNCYTRKFSTYLPEWDAIAEPFFKRDYKSKDFFFELTEERKKDRELFSVYASHILNKMANF